MFSTILTPLAEGRRTKGRTAAIISHRPLAKGQRVARRCHGMERYNTDGGRGSGTPTGPPDSNKLADDTIPSHFPSPTKVVYIAGFGRNGGSTAVGTVASSGILIANISTTDSPKSGGSVRRSGGANLPVTSGDDVGDDGGGVRGEGVNKSRWPVRAVSRRQVLEQDEEEEV